VTRPFRASKFNAKPTRGYASKREADYASELALRKQALNGDVADWLEQVPVKLPGGVKYVIDFMVIYRNDRVGFIEVKGHETPAWRNKMKQLAELHPYIFNNLTVVK